MIRNYLLIISTCLFLFSCDKVTPTVDFTQHEAELVVISNFTNGKDIAVVVSSTRSLEQQDITQYLLNATVRLYRGDVYMETLQLVEPKVVGDIPYYSSPTFRPEVNIEYQLRVSAPGFETVTSESRVPLQINISSVAIDEIQQEIEEDGYVDINFDLNINFEDPVEDQNYYHISLIQQYHQFGVLENGDTAIFNTYTQPILQSAENNTKHEVAHLGGGILLSDAPFDGKVISYTLPVNFQYDSRDVILGKLFIDLRAVSEEYYLYFQGLSRQENASTSPFTDPVFIFDNIEGGKGVFAGYNSSLDSLIISN